MAKKKEAAAEIGHNSGGRLRSFIERIERLNEDKKAVNTDLSEVYAEAKNEGFDTKIIRIVVRRRAMEAQKRAEQDQLVETYESSVDDLK